MKNKSLVLASILLVAVIIACLVLLVKYSIKKEKWSRIDKKFIICDSKGASYTKPFFLHKADEYTFKGETSCVKDLCVGDISFTVVINNDTGDFYMLLNMEGKVQKIPVRWRDLTTDNALEFELSGMKLYMVELKVVPRIFK